jgi:uncharacterized coiled-coil protein SlyX
MNPDTLEQIQFKIAYLERTSAELSEVAFRQDREIHALAAQLRALAERLDAAQPEQSARAAQDERPPHY